jgi:hypothetical protein
MIQIGKDLQVDINGPVIHLMMPSFLCSFSQISGRNHPAMVELCEDCDRAMTKLPKWMGTDKVPMFEDFYRCIPCQVAGRLFYLRVVGQIPF